MQILSRVAQAVVEKPDGIVQEVIFPKVNEETFQNLLAEFRASSPQLRLLRQAVMHRKFAGHYRRMLPALLENLQFRSDNRFQPLIEALAIIQKYLHTHYESFPGYRADFEHCGCFGNLPNGQSEVKIGGQHDHVANGHPAWPCQHEHHHIGDLACFEQAA